MARPKRTTAADLDASPPDTAEPEASSPTASAEPPEPPAPLPPPRSAPKLRGKPRDDQANEYHRAPRVDSRQLVCLGTWTGVVEGRHRIVRRGAPVETIPQVVLDEMGDSAEFGYLQPPLPKSAASEPAVLNLGRGNVRI